MVNNRQDTDKQREWDIYFLQLARLASTRSKCLSRKVGAVLVKDYAVVSTGYNGPPRGIDPCSYRDDFGKYHYSIQSDECPRKRMGYYSGEGIEHCPAVHGEINAIVQAARNGISTADATLYCYCKLPCPNCCKEIINAGISRIVCLGYSEYFKSSGISSLDMLTKADVEITYIEDSELKEI